MKKGNTRVTPLCCPQLLAGDDYLVGRCLSLGFELGAHLTEPLHAFIHLRDALVDDGDPAHKCFHVLQQFRRAKECPQLRDKLGDLCVDENNFAARGVEQFFINRALVGRGFGERIQRDLARADLKLNVAEYLALHIILGFGFFVVGYVLGHGLFLGIVFGIAAFFVPRMYVGYLQGKRLRDFDNQLGDMLNLVVNGLRAGYSSMQAQESVARELPPPISVEFHRVVQEIQLGLPQEGARALGPLWRDDDPSSHDWISA